MEVKKGLNNTQRKLLDEVYTKQFKTRRKEIIDGRQQDLRKLEEKALKNFGKDKEIKKFLEVGKQFYELRKKLDKKLEENGVGVSQYVSDIPELKLSYGYANNYQQMPELLEFKEETIRIENSLGDRETEMRSKIWGINLSYEEVEAEIKELLKNL